MNPKLSSDGFEDWDCFDGKDGFHGLGGEFKITLAVPVKSVRLGLGVYGMLCNEWGNYCKFLSDANDSIDYYSRIPSNETCYGALRSLTPSLLFSYNFSEHTYLSFEMGMMAKILSSPNVSVDISYNYKDIFLWGSWAPSDPAPDELESLGIGLGYRITAFEYPVVDSVREVE